MTAPSQDNEIDLSSEVDDAGLGETAAWKQSGARPAEGPPPPAPSSAAALPLSSAANLSSSVSGSASALPMPLTSVRVDTSVRMHDSPAPGPGEIIDGKYKVERILGSGGMGVVVVATQIKLDRRVAIKLLLPEALRSADVVSRFAREARAAARIQSEHVTRIIDVGTLPSGAPYLVMEYLEGADLAQLLKQRGKFSIVEAVECILHACEALAEAHAAGIVHRDIKPANLFMTKRADGSRLVKVLDFGISKFAEVTEVAMEMTATHIAVGSPLYMSPEQVKAERDVDSRADVWGLGATLYRLITGRAAFDAPSMAEIHVKILSQPMPNLTSVLPGAPVELEQVIVQCLQKDRKNRFQTVAALARALVDYGPAGSQVTVDRTARVLHGMTHEADPPTSFNGPALIVSRSMPPPVPPAPPVPLASTSDVAVARSQNIKASTAAEDTARRLIEARPASKRNPLVIGIVAAAIVGGLSFAVARMSSGPQPAANPVPPPNAVTNVATIAPAPVAPTPTAPALTAPVAVAPIAVAPIAEPTTPKSPVIVAATPPVVNVAPTPVAPTPVAPRDTEPKPTAVATPTIAKTPPSTPVAPARPTTAPVKPKKPGQDEAEFGDRK